MAFYEKVVKVKADVAAVLNCFLRAASTSGGDLGSCQGRPAGTFILTLESSPSHFTIEHLRAWRLAGASRGKRGGLSQQVG
jgi:hypothetical protein